MESNIVFISDLKYLAFILNDGQRGYQSAAKATRNYELKGVFLNYMMQRTMYEQHLKTLFDYCSWDLVEQEKVNLQANWKGINEAQLIKCDTALLFAVSRGEQVALAKFNLFIQNNQLDQDHLNLLSNQRDEIAGAIKKMERLQQKYAND